MDKDLMAVATQLTSDLIRNRPGDAPPLDQQAVADLFLVAYRGIQLARRAIEVDEAQEAEIASRAAEIAAAKAEAEAAAAWIAAGGIIEKDAPAA